MAEAISTTTTTLPEPPASTISAGSLFATFLLTLPQLIRDERDLCGYSGQDPAVDAWICAADASLAATKVACAAVLTAPTAGVAERSLQRVVRLFMDVIESTDPDEVASLRANARLRRWAYVVPNGIGGSRQINLQITQALDALEAWLSLEDQFDAHAEAWADPGPDLEWSGSRPRLLNPLLLSF